MNCLNDNVHEDPDGNFVKCPFCQDFPPHHMRLTFLGGKWDCDMEVRLPFRSMNDMPERWCLMSAFHHTALAAGTGAIIRGDDAFYRVTEIVRGEREASTFIKLQAVDPSAIPDGTQIVLLSN